MKEVFITGGTGYIGGALIPVLIEAGCHVHALVRPGSEAKVPAGALPVIGNALDASTFAGAIPRGATVVHLVGTPHPGPGKEDEFKRVDLASIKATTEALRTASADHLIYISVAHPAPVMRAFIEVREEGERLVASTGIAATILRPWYVLGPGHRWPYLIVPVYWMLRLFPMTRPMAERLGLVTLKMMVAAIAQAVQDPPASGVRIVEVPEIKKALRRQ